MRIYGIAICLMLVCTLGAVVTDETLYTVTCSNSTMATVILKDPKYSLRASSGCTKITMVTPTKYTLKLACASGNTLIVEDKNIMAKKAIWYGDKQIQAFKLTCKEEDNGIVETVTMSSPIKISTPKANPGIKTVTFFEHPNPSLKLILSKSQPEENKDLGKAEPTATLGETLYLTIVDNTLTDTYLIPRNCAVLKQGSNTGEQVLWQLGVSSSLPCTQEPAIIQSQFSQTLENSKARFAFLKIKAFKFTDNDAPITLSCGVRVCQTITSGSCQSDNAALTACSSTPTLLPTIPKPATPSSLKRRRRDSKDVYSSHGRVHQVTATLRVLNNVMEIGTGGSTTISYTLPCLLMSLMAKVIL